MRIILITIISIILWYSSTLASNWSILKTAQIEEVLRNFFVKIEKISIEDEERFWRIHEKIKKLHTNAESQSNPVIKKVVQDIGKHFFYLDWHIQNKKRFFERNPKEENRYWPFKLDEKWISITQQVEWPKLISKKYLKNSDTLNLENLKLIPTYEWSYGKYITDWKRIFFENKELIWFDLNSLQMIPKGWIKDKNSVRYYWKKEQVKDAGSYNWTYWFDKHWFYDFYKDKYISKFEANDPKLHSDWYVIDWNRIITKEGAIKVDINTFKKIDNIFSRDKDSVFVYFKKVEWADSESLEILSNYFFKDENSVWHLKNEWKAIKTNMDADTFQLLWSLKEQNNKTYNIKKYVWFDDEKWICKSKEFKESEGFPYQDFIKNIYEPYPNISTARDNFNLNYHCF